MKIAIIPGAESALQNRMFQVHENDDGDNVYRRVWFEVKEYLDKRGYECNTIDMYPDIQEVDYFIIHNGMHEKYTQLLLDRGLENRIIYRAMEPSVVNPLHTEKAIKKLLKFYRFIITWNDDLVKQSPRIIKTLSLPYLFTREQVVEMPEKKLLVAIYSNKSSTGKNELYSERRRIIDYFDNYAPEEFDLYGWGWEKEDLRTYRGTISSKTPILKKYRFALAFENIKDTKDAISEKIWDCINARVIPIYYGDNNILSFVPENVFIDYRKFESAERLYEYLKKMSEQEYFGYIRNIETFINSDATKKVSPQRYCDDLIRIMVNRPGQDLKRIWLRPFLYHISCWSKKSIRRVKIKLTRMLYHI